MISACLFTIGRNGFLRRVGQLICHVDNIGHVAEELVERLDLVLQHIEFRRLLLPLGLARDGTGISAIGGGSLARVATVAGVRRSPEAPLAIAMQ
jgi:hypothetical protein